MNYFPAACKTLRDLGYSLTPCDVVGLTWVEGPEIPFGAELAINQVINFAYQQLEPPYDLPHQGMFWP